MPVPYGSWPTPITSELVVAAAVVHGELAITPDGSVTWAELRPQEKGRTQLVRRATDGSTRDLLPDGFNARTAVHEYGGGAWWIRDDTLWFANWSDQRLYRLDTGRDESPVPVTDEPERPRGVRWSDGDVSPDGSWIAVVRETHPVGGGPVDVRNEIVLLDTDGRQPARTLVSGPDFVSDPRWSPDGRSLAWLQWSHPDMPWDGAQLQVAELGPDLRLGDPLLVAGRPHEESVFQPRWHADGSLWFVSDRTDWWNLYRWTADNGVEPMAEMDAEIGVPQWVFAQSRYGFLDGGRVAFAYRRDGVDRLAVRSPDGEVVDAPTSYTFIPQLQTRGDDVVMVAGSATAETGIVRHTVAGTAVHGEPELLGPPRDVGVDPSWFSAPEPVEFPTTGGRTAHALFYPPTNPDVQAPEGDLPPLLVLIHGGPTAAFPPVLSMATQFWTSRGFAVVAVNYGGSTGYGRAYRERLDGAWGVVDVDDCCAAAQWLADQGQADPGRLCIRGGSAGGYTTLLALATRDTFAAGASLYGVADLAALAAETHKFESRYLDKLVGPYPQAREVYAERSPITHVDGLDRPLIVLQGLEDEVVPPNQAEMIVDALRAKGVPVAYVPFEGEQHGFRQAANIRRALEAELSFYAQVFGFDLPAAENIEPVPVANL